MLPRRYLALAIAFSFCAAPWLPAATLPRKAPDFTIFLPNKAQMPLSTYKGKTVVLSFILTNCSHCQNFTRVLNKVQRDFGAQGVQVIESAVEEKAEANVPGFVRFLQTPFPVGFNNFQDAVDFLQHPPQTVLPMPVVVFIDREGTIVAQYKASDDFMSDFKVDENVRVQVQKMLSSAASPAKKAPAKKKKQ